MARKIFKGVQMKKNIFFFLIALVCYQITINPAIRTVSSTAGSDKQVNALCLAINNNDVETVVDLLNNNVDVNGTNNLKERPLEVAVANDNAEIAGLLLTKHAKTKYGTQLLHFSLQTGRYKVAQMLISKKLYINVRSNKKQSAIEVTIHKKRTNLTELLIENGAHVNVIDSSKNNLLHLIVSKYPSTPQEIIQALIDADIDVDAQNKNKETPLILAIKHNRTALALLLLEYEANFNLKDKHNRTAFYYVCTKKAANFTKYSIQTIAEALIALNANVNEVDPAGQSLLHLVIINKLDTLASLLIQSGANVNSKDKQKLAPINYAVAGKNNYAVALLVESGATVDASIKKEVDAIVKKYKASNPTPAATQTTATA